MASDRGQNRYSDFVALETLLRFENCSLSHCLLSSWRRFHVFESSHPRFIVLSSYCCLRGVGSMSSSRRIPRFIVLFSSSHCLLSSWRRFHVFESSHPSFHRTVFFAVSSLRHSYVFVSSALPFVDCATYLKAVLKAKHKARGRRES